MNATEGKPGKENVACHRQQRLGNLQIGPTGTGQITHQTHLFISYRKSSLKPEINVSKGFLVRKSPSAFLNSRARDPTGQDSGCGTDWRLSW